MLLTFKMVAVCGMRNTLLLLGSFIRRLPQNRRQKIFFFLDSYKEKNVIVKYPFQVILLFFSKTFLCVDDWKKKFDELNKVSPEASPISAHNRFELEHSPYAITYVTKNDNSHCKST